MILELHERDTEVLEQILSILKNHPEIEKNRGRRGADGIAPWS